MNLTKEVEEQIIKELQNRNLPTTLLDGIKERMSKSQVGYQVAIQEYIDSTRKPAQRITVKSVDNGFSQPEISSFQNRLANTKEAVKQQVLKNLIEAEQEGYQEFLTGNFDRSGFQGIGEIQDHFHTLNLPMAS